MTQVQDIHRQTMDLAEQADPQKLREDTSQLQELLRQEVDSYSLDLIASCK
jgi:hypothetical protein